MHDDNEPITVAWAMEEFGTQDIETGEQITIRVYKDGCCRIIVGSLSRMPEYQSANLHFVKTRGQLRVLVDLVRQEPLT